MLVHVYVSIASLCSIIFTLFSLFYALIGKGMLDLANEKKIFQLKMQYLFLAFVFTNNTILIRISFCRKRLKIGPVVATMSI